MSEAKQLGSLSCSNVCTTQLSADHIYFDIKGMISGKDDPNVLDVSDGRDFLSPPMKPHGSGIEEPSNTPAPAPLFPRWSSSPENMPFASFLSTQRWGKIDEGVLVRWCILPEPPSLSNCTTQIKNKRPFILMCCLSLLTFGVYYCASLVCCPRLCFAPPCCTHAPLACCAS